MSLLFSAKQTLTGRTDVDWYTFTVKLVTVLVSNVYFLECDDFKELSLLVKDRLHKP